MVDDFHNRNVEYPKGFLLQLSTSVSTYMAILDGNHVKRRFKFLVMKMKLLTDEKG